MEKITHVFICCHRGDQVLTRICVASVRYWYPEIPIYLVKDEGARPFSTTEMQQRWDVSVLPGDGSCARGLMNKFRMLFCPLKGRGLYIDSDIVLLGRVIEAIEARGEEFVIAGENLSDLRSEDIDAWYYDWTQLQRFDPSFRFPEFCFNAGQYAWKLGALRREDFAGILSSGEDVRLMRPDIFRCGDQGALNYVVQKRSQEGRLKVGRLDYARWVHDPTNADWRLERIRERVGYPILLHWAGVKPFTLSRMPRADILGFYEDFYYSRIPLARPKRLLRAWATNVVGAYGALRKSIHRCRVQLMPNKARGLANDRGPFQS
jgi:hypothetical protein